MSYLFAEIINFIGESRWVQTFDRFWWVVYTSVHKKDHDCNIRQSSAILHQFLIYKKNKYILLFIRLSQIWEGITTSIIPTLSSSPPDIEVLRVYLLLPLYHEFNNPINYPKLHVPFIRAVLSLDKVSLSILMQWWAEQSNDYFERLIESFKFVAAYIITFQNTKPPLSSELPILMNDPNLEMALKMLEFLFEINNTLRLHRLPCKVFHFSGIRRVINLKKEFYRWSRYVSVETDESCRIFSSIHSKKKLFYLFFTVKGIFYFQLSIRT